MGKFIWWEIPLSGGEPRLDEVTVKVDSKGRIVMPAEIRRQLGIRDQVKLRAEEGEVTLTPAEDPFASFREQVVKGTQDVEKEIRKLRKAAEKELTAEA